MERVHVGSETEGCQKWVVVFPKEFADRVGLLLWRMVELDVVKELAPGLRDKAREGGIIAVVLVRCVVRVSQAACLDIVIAEEVDGILVPLVILLCQHIGVIADSSRHVWVKIRYLRDPLTRRQLDLVVSQLLQVFNFQNVYHRGPVTPAVEGNFNSSRRGYAAVAAGVLARAYPWSKVRIDALLAFSAAQTSAIANLQVFTHGVAVVLDLIGLVDGFGGRED